MGAQQTTNIVIAALGGEGGGTLVSWIEEVACQAGWCAQATSIAGVAQRTGATIYYLELFPHNPAGKAPVMSMFPAAGDIDIAIASEIAEAGRLIQRGFCSRDRTTLITSDHHIYGVTEKTALADGRVDTQKIAEVAAQQCKKLVSFNMLELATQNNTVISATLLGALAGCKALPFGKTDYETVIAQDNKMVAANLAAFNASYHKTIAPNRLVVETVASPEKPVLPQATTKTGHALLHRIRSTFPEPCHVFVALGAEKLLDYQDANYADDYLNKLETISPLDRGDYQLTREVARYLALWMSYEDSARVAQIKTRASRQQNIRQEVNAGDGQIVHITEFFAPRLEELCQPLPARLAKAIIASPLCRKLAAPLTRGKRLRTDTIFAFTVLQLIAFTRHWRRQHYSYQHEHDLIERWLMQIKKYAGQDPDAALAIAKSARMVKGYGKTRERGSRQIVSILQLCEDQHPGAEQISKLTAAALDDDSSASFNQALSALS